MSFVVISALSLILSFPVVMPLIANLYILHSIENRFIRIMYAAFSVEWRMYRFAINGITTGNDRMRLSALMTTKDIPLV